MIEAVLDLPTASATTVASTGLLAAGDLKPAVLADYRSREPGRARVRFVHASPDASPVDVAVKGGSVLFP